MNTEERIKLNFFHPLRENSVKSIEMIPQVYVAQMCFWEAQDVQRKPLKDDFFLQERETFNKHT